MEGRGGDLALVSLINYRGLVRIRDFFLVLLFYNHIILVKIMNVVIFACVQTFTFLCGM